MWLERRAPCALCSPKASSMAALPCLLVPDPQRVACPGESPSAKASEPIGPQSSRANQQHGRAPLTAARDGAMCARSPQSVAPPQQRETEEDSSSRARLPFHPRAPRATFSTFSASFVRRTVYYHAVVAPRPERVASQPCVPL